MKNLLLATIALGFLTTSAIARDYSPNGRDSDHYYRSTDGQMVHGPTHERNIEFGRVTADCRDGTFSYSHHHSGTCSGHGGVRQWEQ